MKQLLDLSNEEAKTHFLKNTSYLTCDLPPHLTFEPILNEVDSILNGQDYCKFQFKDKPAPSIPNVNYTLLMSKYGRLSWRPIELIHPVLYVSLVNTICAKDNWDRLKKRFNKLKESFIECHSLPVISTDRKTGRAVLITNWWEKIEQQSLIYSLEFSYLLHTDVANCYGSLYTHSIAWAIHGRDEAKEHKKPKNKNDDLLGNKIDKHIRAGRYGQTNGISQGSILMDFIAELMLGYVDEKIDEKLEEKEKENARILRYRDDYRIFTNSRGQAEKILKTISDCLREVGMTLNTAKTVASSNIVESSIKPDKLAAITSQYFREKREKTANVQMQLLQIHAFGQQFTNSGALQRLVSAFDSEFDNDQNNLFTENLHRPAVEVLIAITTDIAFTSPSTFPRVARILNRWLPLVPDDQKQPIWEKIQKKIKRIPHNGYMEIWLQRIAKPNELEFESNEPICQIVDGKPASLWEDCWIQNDELKKIMDDTPKIIDKDELSKSKPIIQREEVELYEQQIEQQS
ncbi:hypothetical conserved protein [Candidatus Nitrosoglobus terrae]|uniref:Hypothetical conserved protein n=1 Tax=Candidatus Nitrosoglobus terrae TaxID=1630141 RepID=A0A1Q2SL05_9GAMM|nr:RNA-directed DNA polymerase [Candidatus Nitrosoglobus terrae]BAW79808.1 hypothetical conserved protein [Candidatus Nitrosoglobus terrae]